MPAESVTDSRRVEKLRPDHMIEGFDCGREGLNRYLLRHAWANQQAGAAQTYVGLVGDSVAGYHTLAVGEVAREEAPERLTKGLARHPVPVMLPCSSGCGSPAAGPGDWEVAVARRDAAHCASCRDCGHSRIRGACERRGGPALLREI